MCSRACGGLTRRRQQSSKVTAHLQKVNPPPETSTHRHTRRNNCTWRLAGAPSGLRRPKERLHGSSQGAGRRGENERRGLTRKKVTVVRIETAQAKIRATNVRLVTCWRVRRESRVMPLVSCRWCGSTSKYRLGAIFSACCA